MNALNLQPGNVDPVDANRQVPENAISGVRNVVL